MKYFQPLISHWTVSRLLIIPLFLLTSCQKNPQSELPQQLRADISSTANNDPNSLPLAGKIIVLDPGHGGRDPGAVRDGVNEKDLTLPIALDLRNRLQQQGATVVMTRDTDVYVSLPDRVGFIKKNKPDVFLSIHVNASDNPSAEGVETHYYTAQSQDLAFEVYNTLISELGAPEHHVHQNKFYVISHTSVPATLVEVGFLSNTAEQAKLVTPQYQDQIAQALCKALLQYLAAQATGNANAGQQTN